MFFKLLIHKRSKQKRGLKSEFLKKYNQYPFMIMKYVPFILT